MSCRELQLAFAALLAAIAAAAAKAFMEQADAKSPPETARVERKAANIGPSPDRALDDNASHSRLFINRAGMAFDGDRLDDPEQTAWSLRRCAAPPDVGDFDARFGRIGIDVASHALVAPSVENAERVIPSQAPMIEDLATVQSPSLNQDRSPTPFMQWRPPIDESDRWSLNVGSAPGVPTNVKGLALSYEASNRLSFSSGIGLTGRVDDQYRDLDGSGLPSLGGPRSLPLVAGVDWSPRPGLRVSGYASASFLRDVELFDRRGEALAELDLGERPVIGFDLSLSF